MACQISFVFPHLPCTQIQTFDGKTIPTPVYLPREAARHHHKADAARLASPPTSCVSLVTINLPLQHNFLLSCPSASRDIRLAAEVSSTTS